LGDILTLQSHVTSAIVNEIRVKLTPEDQVRLAATRPVSTLSYENYLKGRYYWNKRSQEGLTKAIKLFPDRRRKRSSLRARLRRPGGLLQHHRLGDSWNRPHSGSGSKARAAALKSLELDNTLAEAHTSLATVRFNYDWDWNAAASGFRRAVELNPSYATAYQRNSLYLMSMGRASESIAEMNRAHDLDPLSISMNFSLGWRLYMAREYDQAIEQLRNTVDMDPGLFFRTSFLVRHTNRKKRMTKRLRSFGVPRIFRRTVHPFSLPSREPMLYRGEPPKQEIATARSVSNCGSLQENDCVGVVAISFSSQVQSLVLFARPA